MKNLLFGGRAARLALAGILFVFASARAAGLPSDYTLLESLTSSGAQHVITDMKPTCTDRFEMKFKLANVSDTMTLWCARGSSTSTSTMTAFHLNSTLRFDRNGTIGTAGAAIAANTDYTVVADYNTFAVTLTGGTYSGTTYATMASGSFTCGSVLAFFASHYNGTGSNLGNYSKMTFYWFKVYDKDGNLTHAYYPARDESATAGAVAQYGLYDIVANKFYANSGSSAFTTAGADLEYVTGDGWRWKDGCFEYPLTLSAGSGCTMSATVDGAAVTEFPVWVTNGASVAASATVTAEGYVFSGWGQSLGNLTAAQLANAELTFPMSTATTLAAAARDPTASTWCGTSSALASVAANWAENAVPADGAKIVLNGASGDLVWDIDIAPASWTQDADYTGTVTFYTGRADASTVHGTLSSDGTLKELHVTGDVTLNGGVWTSPAQSAGDASGVYHLAARIGGALTVGADASLDVSGKGFNAAEGPAVGAHGGLAAWTADGGSTYGDPKRPAALGAGGLTASGGGAIALAVGGALTVNGAIAANGGATAADALGAGAGGSVWIVCQSLAGAANGLITANGGVCANTSSSERSHGGGGRLAVYLTGSGDFQQFPDGNLRAHGGFLASGGGSDQLQGGAGTVYLQPASGASTLIVDNGDAALYPDRAATPAATLVSSVMPDNLYTNVTVRNGAWLCPAAGVALRLAGTLTGEGAAPEPMGAPGDGSAAGAIAFADAALAANVTGTNIFRSLVCEIPGKTIEFASGDANYAAIGRRGTLRLNGADGNPVLFGNASGTAVFELLEGALADVHYTTVRGLDSSGGAWIVADQNNCTIGEGVVYWSLASLTPGAANTWIHAAEPSEKQTLWSDARNWSLGHVPLAGEALIFNDGTTATLPYDLTVPALTVGEHGSFSLGGHVLKVTGNVGVTGELLASDATLVLEGDAVTAALNDAAIGTLEIAGGNVTFPDGFSATRFTAAAPAVTNLTFGAGETYVVGTLDLAGAVGGAATIRLQSATPGTAWTLKVTTAATVAGVKVSDSTVVESVMVGAYAPSVDGGNNSGWIFGGGTPTDVPLAGNYIQSGLVANFDAIENAGAGLHDPIPSEWINLTNGCDNITLPVGEYSFNAKSLVLTQSRVAASNLTCAASTPITVQVYLRLNNLLGSGHTMPYFEIENRAIAGFETWQWGAYYVSQPHSIVTTDSGSSAMEKMWFYVSRTATDIAYDYHSMSTVFTTGYGYDNTIYMDKEYVGGYGNAYWGDTAWGSAKKPTRTVYIGNRDVEYEYGAVRIYSRTLTATEIKVNANVDQIRFEGADPDELEWPAGYCWRNGEVKRIFTIDCNGAFGTVSLNGGAAQSGRLEYLFDVGTTPSITLTATPAQETITFSQWQGTGISSTSTTLELTLTDTYTGVEALFNVNGVHYIPGEFSTIAAALASDSVAEGETLYLLSGTHTFAQSTDATTGYSCIAAIRDKAVTLTGSSPESTILDCGGYGGLIVDHTNAVVANVTIQNFKRSGAAPALYLAAGTVSNCWIGGSSVVKTLKQTANLYDVWVGSKGLLTDSTIRNIDETGNNQWNYNYIFYLAGGIARRTTFTCLDSFGGVANCGIADGQRPRFESCTFNRNYGYQGAGIVGSNADIIDCDFTEATQPFGNYSNSRLMGLSGVCSLVRTKITKTQVTSEHLLRCEAGANVSLTNCLIVKNTVASLGAIHLGGANAKLTLVNTTVAGNTTTAADNCGGISGDGTSSGNAKVTFVNSILWGNTANGAVKNFRDAYSYTDFVFTNSCFTGMTVDPERGDVGNTADDPMFLDTTAGAFNYRLGEGSSCINTGADMPEVTDDLDGKTRPVDGIGYGETKWDIGCYEADGPDYPLRAALTVVGEYELAPCTVTQTVSVMGAALTGLTYEWLAICNAGGVVTTNRQMTSVKENVFENLPAGLYTFEVIVRNDQGDEASDDAANAYRALVDTCYVSPTGTAEWPYATPETATRVISDAAAAARRVVILAGEYRNASVMDASSYLYYQTIDRRGVVLEGADDPSAVLIDCGGKGGFYLANAASRLSGVTLKNFMTTTGSGAALTLSAGASVSNVVVCGDGVSGSIAKNCVSMGHATEATDLVISNFYGTIANRTALYLGGATLRNSRIVGCSTTGACVIYCEKSSGGAVAQIENCLIADNTAKSTSVCDFRQSRMYNSTVTRNTSVDKTGPIFWTYGASTIQNCAFSNNVAKSEISVGTYWGSEYLNLRNSLVAYNENKSAAVVHTECPGYLNIENCTIAWNSSVSGASAGGLHVTSNASGSYASTISVVNSIIWGNTVAGVRKDLTYSAAVCNYSYSAFAECAAYAVKYPSAAGNRADVRLRANCHLTGRSPGRDAGKTLSWHDGGVDLDGKDRVQGAAVDLGCYEDPLGKGLMIILH